MAVLTSTSHKSFNGKYGIGWEKPPYIDKKKASPYSLKKHYDAIPRKAKLWKAEDLTNDPDGFQDKVGSQFGLKFNRSWSTWPWDDFEVPNYWAQSLGEVREIHPCRLWDGIERLDLYDKYPDLREAIKNLGYE